MTSIPTIPTEIVSATVLLSLTPLVGLVFWIGSRALSVSSTRVSAAEARRIPAADWRTSRQPGRDRGRSRSRGAWNRLVDTHERARSQAASLAARQRRITAVLAWIATPLILVWPMLLLVNEVATTLGSERVATTSQSLRVIGLFFGLMFGFFAIPAAARLLLDFVHRHRRPLIWRLLERGSAIVRWLADPDADARNPHERPRRGAVSWQMARRLLDPLEAEIIDAMRPESWARTSDRIRWCQIDSRRVTIVLERKAALLASPGGEVTVDAIRDWLDEAIEVLVYADPASRVLTATTPAEEVLNARARAAARSELGTGFWSSSAAMPMLVAIVVLGSPR